MAKRRSLNSKEIEAARQLKALFNKRKKALGLTQEVAAEKLDMTQSALSQYLNAEIPLNIEALFKVCGLVDGNPYDIHPTLLESIGIGGSFANTEFKKEINDLTKDEIDEIINYARYIRSKRVNGSQSENTDPS